MFNNRDIIIKNLNYIYLQITLLDLKMDLRLAILLLIITVSNGEQFPKILWQYWDSGIKQFQIAQLFDEHHRMIAKGWQVNMLDKYNVKEYLNKIPYYDGDLDKLPFQSTQHKSDYIRIMLLSYYGGVWTDQSTMFLEDLSWLEFESLRNNEDVLNKYGEQPQVFMFTFPDYGSKKQYFDSKTNTNFQLFPGYEMWFMAAKPNSTFMKQFLAELKKGILNHMHSYELGPKYMGPLIAAQQLELGALQNYYYLSSLQLIQYIIQKKQHELDRQSTTSTTNNQNGQSKLLATQFYKIWHIKSEKGPFTILNKWKKQQVDVLMKYSREQLKTMFNITLRYFVKFIGSDRDILTFYYYGINQGKSLGQKLQILRYINTRKIQKYFCPQLYTIYSQSLINQYLIQPSTHNFSTLFANSPYDPYIPQCSQLRIFVNQLKINQELNQKFEKYTSLTSQELNVVLICVVIGLVLVIIGLILLMKKKYNSMRIHRSQSKGEIKDTGLTQEEFNQNQNSK